MGRQALNLRSQSNYVFKISHTRACLKNVQHIKNPIPWKTRSSGSAVLPDKTDPAGFEIYKNGFSEYMNFR